MFSTQLTTYSGHLVSGDAAAFSQFTARPKHATYRPVGVAAVFGMTDINSRWSVLERLC